MVARVCAGCVRARGLPIFLLAAVSWELEGGRAGDAAGEEPRRSQRPPPRRPRSVRARAPSLGGAGRLPAPKGGAARAAPGGPRAGMVSGCRGPAHERTRRGHHGAGAPEGAPGAARPARALAAAVGGRVAPGCHGVPRALHLHGRHGGLPRRGAAGHPEEHPAEHRAPVSTAPARSSRAVAPTDAGGLGRAGPAGARGVLPHRAGASLSPFPGVQRAPAGLSAAPSHLHPVRGPGRPSPRASTLLPRGARGLVPGSLPGPRGAAPHAAGRRISFRARGAWAVFRASSAARALRARGRGWAAAWDGVEVSSPPRPRHCLPQSLKNSSLAGVRHWPPTSHPASPNPDRQWDLRGLGLGSGVCDIDTRKGGRCELVWEPCESRREVRSLQWRH